MKLFNIDIYTNGFEITEDIKESLDIATFRKFNPQNGKTHLIGDANIGEKFKEELSKHLFKYCNTLRYDLKKYKIYESWFTKLEPNDYAYVHDHGDADISGVYYCKTSGSDGKIFFASPLPSGKLYANNQRFTITPMNGGLLLFPGWLKHGVTRNESNNDRISLSFNIRIG